jgi:hypothetical protein
MSSHGTHNRKSFSFRVDPARWILVSLMLSMAFCLTVSLGTAVASAGGSSPALADNASGPQAPAASRAAPEISPPRPSSAPVTITAARVTRYTVKPGDSLSLIAQGIYGSAADWPVIYWANHRAIRWASEISVGEQLSVPPLPASVPAAPSQVAPPAAVSPSPAPAGPGGSGGGNPGGGASGPPASPNSAQAIAQQMMGSFGFSVTGQFGCLDELWERESGWNPYAENPGSGAYGIPQALPGSKMASAGADWATDAATQIRWGLGYIKADYGSPCGAWSHEESSGWY